MNLRIIRLYRQLSEKLSVKAGLYCAGAIVTALFAVYFSPYVSDKVAGLLGGDAVDRVLTILASSMLVVVTFSLSTLISSYAAAGASAPARATALIIRDADAQTALSTFLGAFIFSMVSLVALSTGYYGPKGRVILFSITVFVLSSVILTVIRWIGQLSEMGQLGSVMKKIEKASTKSIQNQSHLFVQREVPPCPSDAVTVYCESSGFLQAVDIQGLTHLAQSLKAEIWVDIQVGEFVYPQLPIARISANKKISADLLESIQNKFFIGETRTFEDDPRFGFIVLSEIGSRALSPAINDPGTAIEIIGSQLRLILKIHSCLQSAQKAPPLQNIYLKSITTDQILEDAFHAIVRDGAANIEVVLFLQRAFKAISNLPEFSISAQFNSMQSFLRSKQAMDSAQELNRLTEAAKWNVSSAPKETF